MYAHVWTVTFLSGPLTYLQLQVLPAAVQTSVPVLALVWVVLHRGLDLLALFEMN
jgi:hypothetical protein